MIPTATVIVPMHSHPIAHNGRGNTKSPITSGAIAMIIITVISGTDTTPFTTAAQNSALIGSIPTKLMPMPISVDTAIVA